jgi:hypothetical protein
MNVWYQSRNCVRHLARNFKSGCLKSFRPFLVKQLSNLVELTLLEKTIKIPIIPLREASIREASSSNWRCLDSRRIDASRTWSKNPIAISFLNPQLFFYFLGSKWYPFCRANQPAAILPAHHLPIPRTETVQTHASAEEELLFWFGIQRKSGDVWIQSRDLEPIWEL